MSGRCRILLVEDNDLLRASLERALTFNGYAVTTAARGSDARAALDCGAMQMLITDIMLSTPKGGLQLAAWVAQHDPDLPVLLISGGHIATLSDIHAPGPELPHSLAVLAKPFTVAQLLQQIELLLQQAQMARPTRLAAD